MVWKANSDSAERTACFTFQLPDFCPFRNKSDDTLRKVLVNIIHPDDSNHNLVFLHYYFTGVDHRIIVKPHQNAKNCVPYLRTFKSTKIALQNSLAATKSVSKALFETTKSVGGVEGSSCAGVLPTGHNQANYIRAKYKKQFTDPIYSITQAMRTYEVDQSE